MLNMEKGGRIFIQTTAKRIFLLKTYLFTDIIYLMLGNGCY